MKKTLFMPLLACLTVAIPLVGCADKKTSSTPITTPPVSSSVEEKPISSVDTETDAYAISQITKTGVTYTVRGVVAAKNTKAIVVHDGKDGVMAFEGDLVKSFNIGDYVEVTGGVTKYNNLFQFAYNAAPAVAVKKITGTAPTIPEAIPLTKEIADGWAANATTLTQNNVQKYKWETTVTAAGTFTCINLEGSETVIEPLYLDTSAYKLDVGSKYEVEGYMIGYSTGSSKYAGIMLTKAEKAA